MFVKWRVVYRNSPVDGFCSATKDDVIDREAVEERLEHIKREEEKDK